MKNELKVIKSKMSEFVKELCQSIKAIPSYYTQELSKAFKIFELQSRIVALSSNEHIADAFMNTIKQIAYSKAESNYETICKYSEEVIKDLMSGMDEIDVLLKYEDILYRLKGWW